MDYGEDFYLEFYYNDILKFNNTLQTFKNTLKNSKYSNLYNYWGLPPWKISDTTDVILDTIDINIVTTIIKQQSEINQIEKEHISKEQNITPQNLSENNETQEKNIEDNLTQQNISEKNEVQKDAIIQDEQKMYITNSIITQEIFKMKLKMKQS